MTKLKLIGRFTHDGGGIAIGSGDKFPADDIYTDHRTGESLSVVCSVDAHFAMPNRVTGPAQLRKMPGVKSVIVRRQDQA